MKKTILISIAIITAIVFIRLFAGISTDSYSFGDGGGVGDCVQIGNITNQNVTSTQITKLSFFTTNINNGGVSLIPEVTNNAVRILRSGTYLISHLAMAHSDGVPTSNFYSMLYLNGSLTQLVASTGGTIISGTQHCSPMNLTSNDYVQLYVQVYGTTPYIYGTGSGGLAGGGGASLSLTRIK